MAKKLETARATRGAFRKPTCSDEKPRAILSPSELFPIGGPLLRPLPAFAAPETNWAEVPADVVDWLKVQFATRALGFPWYWFGSVGSNKTTTAALLYCIAPESIELTNGLAARTTPLAFRLDDMVLAMRKGARSNGIEMVEPNGTTVIRSEANFFAMLRRASIVIVDEVGKGHAEERDRLIVDRLVDVLQFCRVVYTSNIPPKKRDDADNSATLADIYDARIASRIIANGVSREFKATRARNRRAKFEFQK
jgi:hypothetical protein